MPMRDPAFWWSAPGAASALLAPVGMLYGAVTASRMRQDGADAGIPVICAGNLTLGGSGKTPAAIAIAQLLAQAGERPFFLTRGYGGTQSGPIQVMPGAAASDVGDEALLLARAAPAIVARNRPQGAAMARASGASVIVMDDGLQNPSLRKNVALAVVDGVRGTGNGKVFPAGPLRAPLRTQLGHVHAVLIVGGASGASGIVAEAQARERPVFHAAIVPDAGAVASLRSRKVLAFAGIGNPEKFFATLDSCGIEAPARLSFADHHPFSARDAFALLDRAEREGLLPLTTEKDLARMAGDPALSALRERTQALPVRLAIENPKAFADFLLTQMRR